MRRASEIQKSEGGVSYTFQKKRGKQMGGQEIYKLIKSATLYRLNYEASLISDTK